MRKREKHNSGAFTSSSSSSSSPWEEWASLGEQLLQFVAVIAVAAVVAFLGINVVEWHKRRTLPFCDSFQSSDHADDGSCIPCPENGKCWEGHLDCFPGFERHGKSCVRDPETARAVHMIMEFLVQKACRKYTGFFCEHTEPEGVIVSEIPRILEQAGMERQLDISNTKFILACEEALQVVQSMLITKTSVHGVKEMQCPVELLGEYNPFWCRIQAWIFANCILILIIFLMLLVIIKIVVRAHYRRKVSGRAEELYIQVCEVLEEKAHAGGETWVIASYLRDHLLSPSERKNNAAWLLLEQMVYKDSRIDQYPKLVKGESRVVWEWQVKGKLKSPVSNKRR